MNTCDSKGMSIEKEGSESIIIDINTRVILEEHVASKSIEDEQKTYRDAKDPCCGKRF